MTLNRRTFLGAAAVNAAALASMPGSVLANVPRDITASYSSDDWDVSWPSKLNGKHNAVFDNAEVESGYGVWRAASWARHQMEVLKADMKDVKPAIILRHNAIILAMQQPFWDKYSIGANNKVTHPLTAQPTDRNPALLSDVPAPFNQATLTNQLSHGVVVLACNLALQDMVDLIAKEDKVDAAEARNRALGYLIPGIILQPSGVFAATLAQEAGASYVKAR